MGKNKDNKGRQQGALDHAPSGHGPRTTARIAEINQTSSPDRETGPQYDPADIRAHDDVGKDRLYEGREQHDEAEKNSEKTRVARDIDRHNHDSDNELDHTSSQAGAKRKG